MWQWITQSQLDHGVEPAALPSGRELSAFSFQFVRAVGPEFDGLLAGYKLGKILERLDLGVDDRRDGRLNCGPLPLRGLPLRRPEVLEPEYNVLLLVSPTFEAFYLLALREDGIHVIPFLIAHHNTRV